ncbi:CsbD family protein [Roseicella frigidaeris]|uniref:CsbD-like domain-containing protein n=1 Tax=Roseicella frigidaeris TaxID=2230885 RepID=A0A327M3S7_9PROT|nr:CsbD family protein [Roseicella frigidaeris]RAI57580.1 hypothetical protein DOO78_18535 [Roseicella frigidaeris]
MDKNEIEGAARNVAGKAQEAYGKFTDDAEHEAKGVARQVAGKAQEAYGDARDVARDAARQVGQVVEKQPVLSLLVAGAVGYALALLTLGVVDRGSRRW